MSMDYVTSNLRVNGLFYLGDHRFPVLYSMLAFLGLLFHKGRTTLIAALYFLGTWSIFLFFYAGSYNYGADVRFSLLTYPAIAVLAGSGLATLVSALTDRWPEKRFFIRQACAFALCTQFLWYIPQVRALGEEAWAARADVNYAGRVIPTLPPNSIVFTHNPSIFLLRGVNAAQMSLLSDDPQLLRQRYLNEYAGGVFLHWNYWCNVDDPLQVTFCTNARDRYQTEVTDEYFERDQRFAFYRITQ
jgi:hypothetical protein